MGHDIAAAYCRGYDCNRGNPRSIRLTNCWCKVFFANSALQFDNNQYTSGLTEFLEDTKWPGSVSSSCHCTGREAWIDSIDQIELVIGRRFDLCRTWMSCTSGQISLLLRRLLWSLFFVLLWKKIGTPTGFLGILSSDKEWRLPKLSVDFSR
jgi:hypothetical protein